MTDAIDATINIVASHPEERSAAIGAIKDMIVDAFPGDLPEGDAKMVEVYAGTLVSDLETGTIDGETASASLREAVELAKSGDPGFVGLIQIGAE